MEKRELLRKAIAEFFEVDSSHVGPTFPLSGPLVASSVGRAALASRIRHQVGLKSNAVYSAGTYGELESEMIRDAIGVASSSIGSPIAGTTKGARKLSSQGTNASLPAPGGYISCGIDIELVENLPHATDYWEDPFYKSCFTPAEIAYCLMQETPALHFTARWCAKEALKKCDPDFISEEMKSLEVVSGESQGPALNYLADERIRRLPHAVSISHTPLAAIAIVVKVGNESIQPTVSRPTVAGTSGVSPAPTDSLQQFSRNPFAILQTLLVLAALCVSVLALLKSYHAY